MNRLIIESNRELTKKKINEEIDKLYNEIRKISLENEDLKKCNSIIETDKTRFAIAYAKKIGVILTQRQYNKQFVNAKKSEVKK